MRRHRQLVRGGERADALALGEAAGDRDVGLEDVDGAAPRSGRGSRSASARSRRWRSGCRSRAAPPRGPARLSADTGSSNHAEIARLDLAREAQRVAHAPRAVRVHHDADVGAERIAHLAHARGGVVDALVLQARRASSPRGARARRTARAACRCRPRAPSPPLAYAGTRSRYLPPSSRHTGTPSAWPARSHSAMSMPLIAATVMPRRPTVGKRRPSRAP